MKLKTGEGGYFYEVLQKEAEGRGRGGGAG